MNATPSRPSRDLAAAQAQWLAGARTRVLRWADIARRQAVLEIGAGWGVNADDLSRRAGDTTILLDRDLPAEPADSTPGRNVQWLAGDATDLPLPADAVDLIFSQFCLLWVDDLAAACREMRRVLMPGGAIALVEPDYGGLMEHPPDTALRDIWLAALAASGASPMVGRALPGALADAGFDVSVRLLDRVEPPRDERFTLLRELPLTDDQRAAVDRAQQAATTAGTSAVAHLPCWLILAR